MPKVMQQAIEQHFPKVHASATIKVNKESTRKSSDTEFHRAAIRARKQATSNDVRKLIGVENGGKIKLAKNENHVNNNNGKIPRRGLTSLTTCFLLGTDEKSQNFKGNGQNGYSNVNGFKGQNGAIKHNQTNGKIAENNNRERQDSHLSTVSAHVSRSKSNLNSDSSHRSKQLSEKLYSSYKPLWWSEPVYEGTFKACNRSV